MLAENDHRSLGPRLQLFHLQEESPGGVFWHPRGWVLYRLLEARLREELLAGGYQEVRSPQVLHRALWERSGHWQHFRPDMLLLDGGEEEPAFALKPVSCPGHLQLAAHRGLSYRDLPLRLAEFGLCHRNESSGALHGLFRLRQFCQDDGHLFCAPDQVAAELRAFCARLPQLYRDFGFQQIEVLLSGRPESSGGDLRGWEWAEGMLREAAESAGFSPRPQPGQGAFYGPKLEFGLRDAAGRLWQCGTLQLDVILPARFGVSYVDAAGQHQVPVMIHRALLGSLERFIGILLEQHGAALPIWLAPQQVVLVQVGEEAADYAGRVLAKLEALGLRAGRDCREVSLGRKVHDAHLSGVPFVAVVGRREAADGSLSLRERGGQVQSLSLEAALCRVVQASLRGGDRR